MATAAAVRSELGVEERLREFVHQTYDELQRDVARARTELEHQEKEYVDALREEVAQACDPLRTCRLRAEEPATSDAASSVQTVQSGKHVIMKGQSRHKDVTSQEKITESHDLSMRDLADLIWDDAFRKDSKNKRKLPHRTNKNNAHATGNERVRLDQEEENIPACEPQRQALAGPQQGISCLQTMVGVQTGRTNKNNAHATKNGRVRPFQEDDNIPTSVPQRQTLAGSQQGIPGLQTTAGVQTGIAYQNAETMEPVIGFSHQQGVTQIEPAPGEPTRHDPRLQAMVHMQPERATFQTISAHIREYSTFTESHQRMALRNQMGTNANVLLSRSDKERPSPAESVYPPPQYPAMIQIDLISREDISSSRVQATRAPVDPQEKCLPSHEIPEATGTPPETSHVEAEPSTPVGHMQQPSDHLVEPDSADNGAVPILTMRIRSTTRICTNPESSTSMTNSTHEEITVPGSGLRVTVSQTKQHLEKMDARGLHMAHEENGTVVREVLVPGGRVGAPPFPGLDKSGMLRDAEDSGVLRDAEESGVLRDVEEFGGRDHIEPAHVDEKPSIGREAHIVRLKCKPESGEIKEGAYTHLMSAPERQHDAGPPAPSLGIPPPKHAAREVRADVEVVGEPLLSHVGRLDLGLTIHLCSSKRRDDTRPATSPPETPPPQSADQALRADPQVRPDQIPGTAPSVSMPSAVKEILRQPEKEASHEDASDRTPLSTPKEEDDECILEPYVERFHFPDEELAKAFPREAHAIVPSATPTSVCQETVESIVSRQNLSIVSGNVKYKTWHVKQHSRTKNIQRFSQPPRTEITETSAMFLDSAELKCDDKDVRFFQATSKIENFQAQKFHVKQAAPGEHTLPPEFIRKLVHPSKPETETVERDEELHKQPTIEHVSCHLLCWDRKEEPIDAMKCHREADPLTKDDSSCMVICWDETPTVDAKSASEISSEEIHVACSTDEVTTDVSNGTQEATTSCQLLCWEAGRPEVPQLDTPPSLMSDASSCEVLCWDDEQFEDVALTLLDTDCNLLCWDASVALQEVKPGSMPSLSSINTCDVLCWAEQPELVVKVEEETDELEEHIYEDIELPEFNKETAEVMVKEKPEEEPQDDPGAYYICKDILVEIVYTFPPTAMETVQHIILQLLLDITGIPVIAGESGIESDGNGGGEGNTNFVNNSTNNSNRDGQFYAGMQSADEYNNFFNDPIVFNLRQEIFPVSSRNDPGMFYPVPLTTKKISDKESLVLPQAQEYDENYKETLASCILNKIHSKILGFQEPVTKTMEMPPLKVKKNDETIIAEIVNALKQLTRNTSDDVNVERKTPPKTRKGRLGLVIERKHDEKTIGTKPIMLKPVQLQVSKRMHISEAKPLDILTKDQVKQSDSSPQPRVLASASRNPNDKQVFQKSPTLVTLPKEPLSTIPSVINNRKKLRKLGFTPTYATSQNRENLNKVHTPTTCEKHGKAYPESVDSQQNNKLSRQKRTVLEVNYEPNSKKENLHVHSTPRGSILTPSRVHTEHEMSTSHNLFRFHPYAGKTSHDDSKVHFGMHAKKDMHYQYKYNLKQECSDTSIRSSDSHRTTNVTKVKSNISIQSIEREVNKCDSSVCEIICWKNCRGTEFERILESSQNGILTDGKNETAPAMKTVFLRERVFDEYAGKVEPPGRTRKAADKTGQLACTWWLSQDAWDRSSEVEQNCPEHEIQSQPTSGITPTGLNVILRIGKDGLLLGWNKLPENDSSVAGFEVLQQSYFLARLVQDLRGDYRGEYALSVLFAGAVLPSSALVAVNYWSLVWVDPGLVDGQGLLDVFPSWLNHVMHSNVVALCLLELACNPRLRYPPRQPGMAVFSLLVSAYLAVCMYALSHDDFWIYPFFKTMSGNQKAAFFIYNYLVGSTVYFTGEWLCGVLRGFRTEKSHLKGNST